MRIFTAPTAPEVHIVCELLKSHCIDCQVIGEGIAGLQGELPFDDSTCPSIWLLDISQLGQAHKIIQQLEQQDQSTSKWQCQQCDELIEMQFRLCWKCNTTTD
ncbi:DUF2007 domain-containing protein [Vibrio hepatarius]|uniref:DUF2007 domain-containing protein n=1 Tax=Vibrio hepatarius TaxID=171383 RepID=UPI001C09E179|nr:DUF2007 domain-containing protein [Vibrio hepatarius]MBU2895417.1 DUF2007 domain-containing protein [Vibrio hepatarius]